MKDYRDEDRAMRAKLERNSSAGARVNMAGVINGLIKAHDTRSLPGLQSYAMIKLLQHNGGASAREARRHNKARDAYLARATASETTGVPANERDDARQDRIGPELRAGRVRDTGGSIDTDARTRGEKFSGQGVITLEGMRAMAAAASLRRYF